MQHNQLRSDAMAIWQAGLEAVLPSHVVPQQVVVDGDWLCLGDEAIDLRSLRRIAIVGAGKAAAGMTVALEAALGDELLDQKDVTGWVNVPGDCLLPTRRVHLHAGRPAGVNLPQPEGVAGTREIMRIVSALGSDDLCLCVITGGASALLVAPTGISLAEKTRITELLSGSGANIKQLNTVRKQLSNVKGGGLSRQCRAGRIVSLIISDVLGDPLETIASGPTCPDRSTPSDALQVLHDLQLYDHADVQPIVAYLEQQAPANKGASSRASSMPQIKNIVIANNATAVDAAGAVAEQLGYTHAMVASNQTEGWAEDVGRRLAGLALEMRDGSGPTCLISGGEPVVELADESRRGKGGRNQQLALAALTKLGHCRGVALLSGGTDGEDGPTDAAGAFVDEQVAAAVRDRQLDPLDYLARNDAYHFFEQAGGLLKTGPTHTNVCDIRVVTLARTGGK